ncbi:hypothetical protein NDN08_007105 [Rhodosorus marinus]|uniref:Band 7 domain-containing protein n=1 Tax=Rhodosorus marinus TaxID=101924 RepID=A0AAV8UKT5_9RHOD|nr:hypothetical protein NDN08_007105 [Rhodosorus marinus]
MGLLRVVGPNKAMVISGRTGRRGQKDARILVGGRAVVWPLLERCDLLSLELRTIQVESNQSMTVKGVSVNIIGVCQVKVSGYSEVDGSLVRDENAIRLAAQHFLGATDDEIDNSIRQTMEGHQRAILGSLSVEEVYRDRRAFSESVKRVATTDMRNMGLEIVSYTISHIRDSEGYLEALGVMQTQVVKREAQVAKAKNTAEAAKLSADYDLQATVEIDKAEKRKAESRRSVSLTQAAMKKEVGTAEEVALRARELEKEVLLQEIVANKTKQATKEAEEHVKVVELEAKQERIRMENLALAEGNALLLKREKDAAALRVYAEAEADRILATGRAEAEALRKRYEVELEMLRGKAEAYRQFGEAAIAVQAIEALPNIAEAIANPLSQTEKMVFIGGGDGNASSSFMKDISKGISTVTETVNAMTGVNINKILQNYANTMDQSNTGGVQKAIMDVAQKNPESAVTDLSGSADIEPLD